MRIGIALFSFGDSLTLSAVTEEAELLQLFEKDVELDADTRRKLPWLLEYLIKSEYCRLKYLVERAIEQKSSRESKSSLLRDKKGALES